MYTEKPACRVCGGPFEPVLDLGPIVPADFVHPHAPDPAPIPLDLVQCGRCDLVQLRHTTDPNQLYRQQYWYRSGVNEVMVEELRNVVEQGLQIRPDAQVVLDVGCNDGTLLRAYPETVDRIGVEPVSALASVAGAHADVILNGFFPEVTSGLPDGSVDILTSIAMFYDLDNPKAFVAEVDRLLSRDGVWMVQMQDLGQMLQLGAFDNICHEHLCYYTPETFQTLLTDTNLRLFGLTNRPINGGSLRFLVGRRHRSPAAAAGWAVSRHDLDRLPWTVERVRTQLLATFDALQAQDVFVDLYAASTKASTLLQVCGLSRRQLREAVERSPEKCGLETAKTRIPIVSEETWRADPAPVTLLGAWQFRNAFLTREAQYIADGGAFLVPLPSVEVIYGHDGVSPLRRV